MKKKKTKNEEMFDKNLNYLSNDDNTISEEDYYLSDALAQDGESIEDYGI
mgnify:FL=1